MALKKPFYKDLRFLLPAGGFLLFFLFTRFWELGLKPYHHDESLYAIESWRYATKGMYSFNPMLHGPFLFHLQAALFKFLPINDFTGRLPVALAGLGVLLGGIFLFRGKPLSILVWLAVVALSPIMAYFSRFLGMDILMACLALGLLISLIQLEQTRKIRHLYMAFGWIAAMYCTKLNSLFYFFIFATFFLIWLLVNPRRHDYVPGFKAFKGHWIGACLLAIAIIVLLYSSLGQNWGGVLDGLYRKMIPYWVTQHTIQRIKGPFHYYVPYLAIYELPILFMLLGSFLSTRFANAERSKKTFFLLGGLLALWGASAMSWPTIVPLMSKVFHMEHPFHPVLAAGVLGSAFLVIRQHFGRGEIFQAFTLYWGLVSFLLYAYAGEKIPWLNVHILLPLHLYVAWSLPGVLSKQMTSKARKWAMIVLGVVCVGWQGMITVRATHFISADPRESLVYTHTSWDMIDLVENIHHLSETSKVGEHMNLQVVGASAWPLYWYLRSYRRWFFEKIDMSLNPWVIIHDWTEREKIRPLVGENYEEERFKLREWWVPDLNKMTVTNALRYYFTREPFSIVGSQDVVVFVRKDVWGLWPQLSSGDSRTSAPRSNNR